MVMTDRKLTATISTTNTSKRGGEEASYSALAEKYQSKLCISPVSSYLSTKKRRKMKQKIVFATNNTHKLEEVAAMLGDAYEVLSLRAIGCDEEIPETAETFAGNAILKARYVKEHYGYDCFADDSGLEVDALNGAPGVYSARYSGGGSEENMAKLLQNMSEENERSAQFRTIIALLIGEDTHLFEGIVRGHITRERKGEGGFGYDPIFVPVGYDLTFAELGNEVKNRISHRAKAVEQLVVALKQKN
jgi:XTP/dITP diphosphohydrolase